MKRPFLSYFTTRELPYPSDTKMLPAASHATSVGRLNTYGSAFDGAGSPGSGLRPSTMATRPSGVNLITMLVPSSTAHMLSCGSTRTACANAKPYSPSPISRT